MRRGQKKNIERVHERTKKHNMTADELDTSRRHAEQTTTTPPVSSEPKVRQRATRRTSSTPDDTAALGICHAPADGFIQKEAPPSARIFEQGQVDKYSS